MQHKEFHIIVVILTMVSHPHSAVQIHYNGALHWSVSSNIGGAVKLYDSKASAELTSSMDEQLAAIYQGHRIADDRLMVTRVPVQQQEGGVDCGVYSIAFAFHLLHGDNVRKLSFDQPKMRQHLAKCFEDEELRPFPSLGASRIFSRRKGRGDGRRENTSGQSRQVFVPTWNSINALPRVNFKVEFD